MYVYLLEGDFGSTKISRNSINDWAQTILIIDAETGTLLQRTTHRLAGKTGTSQFIKLAVRESTKGVPAREVTSLDRPLEIPVAAATPAP